MLVGTEQKLDGLPSHVALGRQRRHGRRCKCIGRRLQRVEAAEGLVDEGQGRVRRFDEERVVVTTYQAVERGELFGSKTLQVPWCNVLDLRVCDALANTLPWDKTCPGIYKNSQYSWRSPGVAHAITSTESCPVG